MTPELFTHLNGDYRERACTPPPEAHLVGSKCQYSEDVGMPEYRCAIRCQYAVDADALVAAERKRCLDIVDEYIGGGRSFVMRKIDDGDTTEGSDNGN